MTYTHEARLKNKNVKLSRVETAARVLLHGIAEQDHDLIKRAVMELEAALDDAGSRVAVEQEAKNLRLSVPLPEEMVAVESVAVENAATASALPEAEVRLQAV